MTVSEQWNTDMPTVVNMLTTSMYQALFRVLFMMHTFCTWKYPVSRYFYHYCHLSATWYTCDRQGICLLSADLVIKAHWSKSYTRTFIHSPSCFFSVNDHEQQDRWLLGQSCAKRHGHRVWCLGDHSSTLEKWTQEPQEHVTYPLMSRTVQDGGERGLQEMWELSVFPPKNPQTNFSTCRFVQLWSRSHEA